MSALDPLVLVGVLALIIKELVQLLRWAQARRGNANSTVHSNPGHSPSASSIWAEFNRFREETNKAHREASEQRGQIFQECSALRERAAGLEARVTGLEHQRE